MVRRARRDTQQHPQPMKAIRAPVPVERDTEDNRLWQHGLHEDTQLFQRSNFFLLAESLLIVAYSGLLAVSEASGASHTLASHVLLITRVMATFGLMFTIAWLYVGHRHLKYCRYIQAKALDRLSDYRATRAGWQNNPISSLSVITYMIPILVGVLWILFLSIV